MAMVVVCLGPPLSHDCCDMKKMFKYGIENKALAEMKAHIVAELFNSCVTTPHFQVYGTIPARVVQVGSGPSTRTILPHISWVRIGSTVATYLCCNTLNVLMVKEEPETRP